MVIYNRLQGNDIGDIGIATLGKALCNNTTLKTLFIFGNNKMTQEGVNECINNMEWKEDKQIVIDVPYVWNNNKPNTTDNNGSST